jgi:hypothetical protein
LTRRTAFDIGRGHELRWDPTGGRFVVVTTATCSSERETGRNQNDERLHVGREATDAVGRLLGR